MLVQSLLQAISSATHCYAWIRDTSVSLDKPLDILAHFRYNANDLVPRDELHSKDIDRVFEDI